MVSLVLSHTGELDGKASEKGELERRDSSRFARKISGCLQVGPEREPGRGNNQLNP